ncbi:MULTISPECIES: HAMP domain-containing sensor histidine kinase [unclassified Bacillus (in: firmicutes)]|uniref:sensor histidine kinase n=1 Tax=unclassified Bacillus (in: firmicutes) TaxID=185979 RepID=UPI0008EF8711|nr:MULTISPECIES: ATP-binding protein [unclassified Bacillus (in: firmicutes)]SFA88732.1 hypothetical protein SAMN02799634_102341 [Bacillus sp. UNCCL13]SFQ84683.1 hypothetical protein SAMN04488577_2459 [Bacillus sp. cl95]
MTFKAYVSDQKRLIAMFVFMMIFVGTTIFSDPYFVLEDSNIAYLFIGCTLIFLLYLMISFNVKRNQLKKFSENMTYETNEQRVYFHCMMEQQDVLKERILFFQEEQKEQLEYMTTWFHEIKNPLAVSKLIIETNGQPTSLLEEINRIESYVDQALYFSRLSEFNKDYLIQEISVPKIIKDLLKAESNLFISKKITLVFDAKKMKVLSDQKALSYVIKQILLNSIKYTDQNGTIKISLCPENKYISIWDNGIGISSTDLPRVFEKGFTGKNGRLTRGATGMGLYLSNKMAEKLGHKISITSEYGEFTEVRVHFPDLENYYLL